MQRRRLLAACTAAALARPGAARAAGPVGGRVWRVGPDEALKTPSQAARQAQDGDVVEIAAGTYAGDAAVWLQQRLVIRAVGGPVRLQAEGRAAEGKALWVLRGGDFEVSGIEFAGVRVPHRNGAGIRFEGGRLRVRGCRFLDSECGILTAGGEAHRETALWVEDSEFGGLGDGLGQAHGLYAGAIGRLVVRGCHFHDGRVGHLIKSRAAVNDIRFNLLADGPEGRASYEVDLPNGGVAALVGNVVQQGPRTENWSLVSFGQEGWGRGPHRLVLASNTLVNDRAAGGLFVRVVPGAETVALFNNLRCGPGRYEAPGALVFNDHALPREAFVDADRQDYRPRPGAAPAHRPPPLAVLDGLPLEPDAEFQAPLGLRPLPAGPRRAGAFAGEAA